MKKGTFSLTGVFCVSSLELFPEIHLDGHTSFVIQRSSNLLNHQFQMTFGHPAPPPPKPRPLLDEGLLPLNILKGIQLRVGLLE